jgi:hypothetical protein
MTATQSPDARTINTLVMHMHADRAVWDITLDLTDCGKDSTFVLSVLGTKLF